MLNRSSGYFSFTSYATTKPNPQPGLARLWIKQARYDLDAVNADTVPQTYGVPYEWACFKSYQVTKVCVKTNIIQVIRACNVFLVNFNTFATLKMMVNVLRYSLGIYDKSVCY